MNAWKSDTTEKYTNNCNIEKPYAIQLPFRIGFVRLSNALDWDLHDL